MDGRIAAVVLAAGAGSRFGGGKLLAPVEGRPVLQHVLDRLAETGLDPVVVVIGDDADALESGIAWRTERRVRNPQPRDGLSSSVRIGIGALPSEVVAALIVLGDQPDVSGAVIAALLGAGVDAGQPIAVPAYAADRGRNPVLLGRAAFPLVAATSGDRGLGPLLLARPDLVREVPVEGANPDVDTRPDLVAVLEARWAARVRANREQVERVREVPDDADFYAPVTGLFRADPRRTDEPALQRLLAMVQPGETWLDIGAGAGRYALPIARALAPSGGRVIALDPSAGMLRGLREIAAEHDIENVEVVEARWPAPDGDFGPFAADVALIAHVSYDVEAIGPFLGAMEGASRRRCVAVLMERQPSSIAEVCWPGVWGEERVPLPALPEFVELLRAMGRDVQVEMIEREPRRFESRETLTGYLRRQLWLREGSAADERFVHELDAVIVDDGPGRVGLRGQRPLPIGIATWTPPGRVDGAARA